MKSSDSTPGQGAGEQVCVVCGKDLSDTRPTAVLYVEGRALPVCCPLCFEAYQKSPKRFADRASVQETLREAQRLLGMNEIW